MSSIADLSDEPKYTIKSVSRQTGIRPVTLRAWERRYSLLDPHRSENRYRLYSERDIAVLQWVRARVENGLSISSAASEFKTMRRKGAWPEAVASVQRAVFPSRSNPPEAYTKELYKSLISHDETRATELLREVFAGFDLMTAYQSVVSPCLVEIGEAWYRGEVRVATEHFATSLVRGHLLSIFQSMHARRSTPQIVVGCGPDELHEIGALMMAVLLRQEGYRIEYLGPDLPLDDLVEYLEWSSPAMMILSATTQDSAEALAALDEKIIRLSRPPIIGFGGPIFNQKPALREQIPGVFLGRTMEEACRRVHELLR